MQQAEQQKQERSCLSKVEGVRPTHTHTHTLARVLPCTRTHTHKTEKKSENASKLQLDDPQLMFLFILFSTIVKYPEPYPLA